jgi:hypothetical protein
LEENEVIETTHRPIIHAHHSLDESNRGRKRLIVAFTRPISHHILRKSTSSPMIIALVCASAEAVLLPQLDAMVATFTVHSYTTISS